MLSFAFLLCGIILVSFIFLFLRQEKIRIIAASSMAISGMVLIPLFYKIQMINGNPDLGKEFEQLYLPLIIFAVSALIGTVITILHLKKRIRNNHIK